MNEQSVTKPALFNTKPIVRIIKSSNALSCDFYFNFDALYPGEIISGYIIVSADKECLIDQIIMEVYGTATCSWTYDKHLVKPPRIYKKGTVFSGKHRFFFSRHTLAGGHAGNVKLNGATEEMYYFRTSFPPHLPASWTGKYGTIKYAATIMLKEHNKPTQIFTEDIVVYPRRILKLEEHLLYEARKDVSRNFRYGFINLGNVKMSIWLPLCGIAAGQGIPLVCTIKNKSTLQFGGLIFVLTQLQIFRSTHPCEATRTYRKDICRIPRMVDILQGEYEFYAVLETDADIYPTNQFRKSDCCHVIYEVWASLQGVIPRYKAYGYPNIDTPAISVIVGTEPLCEWNNHLLSSAVMKKLNNTRPPILMEPLPPDDDIEEMLNYADEELDNDTERNLERQLISNSKVFEPDDESENTDEFDEETRDEDVHGDGDASEATEETEGNEGTELK